MYSTHGLRNKEKKKNTEGYALTMEDGHIEKSGVACHQFLFRSLVKYEEPCVVSSHIGRFYEIVT